MCTFCDISSGQVPAHLVLEDELTVAFLDHRPLFAGHSLLIPRDHHESLGELPDELLAPLFGNARTLAVAMEEGLEAKGAFVALNNKVSQSVPHLHIHVVPRRPKDGLRGFFWPRTRYADDAEMAMVAATLRAVTERP